MPRAASSPTGPSISCTRRTTTPGPFAPGDPVLFRLEVTNEGSLDATNIQLNDYIPAGLRLTDSAWEETTPGVATLKTPIASLAAGLIGLARLTGGQGGDAFAERLLAPPYRTFLLPGSSYDCPDHIRLGVGGDPATPRPRSAVGGGRDVAPGAGAPAACTRRHSGWGLPRGRSSAE